MLEMSDETSASCYFIFEALRRPIGKFFVMCILHPFKNIAKKVPGSARIFTFGEMVDWEGVQNSSFLNIAELNNSIFIPKKLIRRDFSEVAGDIFPFLFTR